MRFSIAGSFLIIYLAKSIMHVAAANYELSPKARVFLNLKTIADETNNRLSELGKLTEADQAVLDDPDSRGLLTQKEQMDKIREMEGRIDEATRIVREATQRYTSTLHIGGVHLSQGDIGGVTPLQKRVTRPAHVDIPHRRALTELKAKLGLDGFKPPEVFGL
jgi:hypothetical protein